MTSISVILPILSETQNLQVCIESIISQTLKDIELICIVNGRNSKVEDVLLSYSQKDKRIKLFENEECVNIGIVYNSYIEKATGEYIVFANPFNLYYHNMFEELYKKAKEFNSDITVCKYENFDNTDEKLFKTAISSTRTIQSIINPNSVIDKLDVYHSIMVDQICVYNKIFKKDFLKYYDIKFSKIKAYYEPMFEIRAMVTAKNITFVNTVLCKLKMNSTETKTDYANFIKTINRIKRYITTIGMDKFFELNLSYYIFNQADIILENTKNKRLLKELKKYLTKNDYNTLYKRHHINYFTKIIKTKPAQDKIYKNKDAAYNYPIDLVYLWVDGNDAKWQQEKLYWQKQYGLLNENAINNCRFVDNQELRYSLRSVAKNMSWINHIYIVTNGQKPLWLDENNDKITIVTHDEIAPKDSLPLFNSTAIELLIANIPNLSEHFIYSNDDFFVYRPLTPNFFFDNKGKPIVRLVKQNWTKDQISKNLYLQGMYNAIEVIKKRYGKSYKYEIIHNMEAFRKSYFTEYQKIFKEEYDKTIYSKFRSPNDVHRLIINLYMIAKKNCKLKINITHSNRKKIENALIRLSSPSNMNDIVEKHTPVLKLFCINDNEYTLQENREMLKPYLDCLFCEKQDWEID